MVQHPAVPHRSCQAYPRTHGLLEGTLHPECHHNSQTKLPSGLLAGLEQDSAQGTEDKDDAPAEDRAPRPTAVLCSKTTSSSAAWMGIKRFQALHFFTPLSLHYHLSELPKSFIFFFFPLLFECC